MSHIPQRKEKDCLNCGTIVQGRYCQNCGQENVVPKETFWHMVTHFFYDITHFDSNFFVTIKDLLFKPGFLSKEYMAGKRASYLHPIKMYVFTSAMFFLLFFSFFAPKTVKVNTGYDEMATQEQRQEYIGWLKAKIKRDPANTEWKTKLAKASDTAAPLPVADIVSAGAGGGINITFTGGRYKNYREYDSVQKTLPKVKQDNWIERRFMKAGLDMDEQIRKNPQEALKKFVNSVLHKLPYMLLISLPFFALILKLVYIRRKQFYYADHGVFTIHLYVFSFLLLLAVFMLAELEKVTGLKDLEFVTAGLFLLLLYYLYRAMRVFYGQGGWKTFFKFLFVSFWSFVMVAALFVLFILFSAFTL